MKKHLLKFGVYYIILNILILILLLAVFVIGGIKNSEDGIYKCEDAAFHFQDCSFGDFLVESIFWIGFGLILTLPFVQLILIFTSLISYFTLNFLSNKFKKVNERNLFVKFLIFFFINLTIFFSLFFIYLIGFSDFPPDQL